MIQKTELTWATVNTTDPAEMAEFDEQEERKAGERVKIAFKRLRDLGIVDEKGELLSHELPADMRQVLLVNESFLRAYVQWQGHSPEAQAGVLAQLPAALRAKPIGTKPAEPFGPQTSEGLASAGPRSMLLASV